MGKDKFIGSVLGPRGNTHKKLESETGTKIEIRGKGSRDTRKTRNFNDNSDQEELHVHITGDTVEQVDTAFKIISELLAPKDDADNEWKKMQLRELRRLNGTDQSDQDFFK